MKKIKRSLSRIIKLIKLEEMRILPGQLAYFFMFSLLTILSLIGLIGSNFVTTELTGALDKLPNVVATVLESALTSDKTSVNSIIFIVVCLYVASGGCQSMIITSNVIYKIKNNSALKQSIKSLLMTFILILLLIFTVLVPAFGELIINTFKVYLKGDLLTTVEKVFDICKTPVSLVFIYIGIKILYTLAPDKTIKSRYNTRGAIFTSVGWVIATKIYSIYLSTINTYSIYYGSLANMIIVLFWLYILAYIFTLGIAINAESYYNGKMAVNQDTIDLKKALNEKTK